MRSVHLVILTIVMGLATYAPTCTADEGTLRALIAQYAEGVLNNDADKAAAPFAKDAIFMPYGSPATSGRESIRDALAATADPSRRSFEMKPLGVEIDGDWGIAHTSNSGFDDTQPIDTKSLFVFRRTAIEGWRIYRYMWTPNRTE